MAATTRHIDDLPNPLTQETDLAVRLGAGRPAVFLDYDGTLTPIVERPEDAVLSASMREVVRALAERCPVCVVSGRDWQVVQQLMGLRNLIVAGSHGFDIWSPDEGTIEREMGSSGIADLLEEVTAQLREALDAIDGAEVEPKKSSVAVHVRRVADAERAAVERAVDTVLAEHPDELRKMRGKMVYDFLPRIDWDKGKAVLYLLEALDLNRDDVVPLYLGDDVTDEDAFRALQGCGIGIFVGRVDDPEVAERTTAADYILHSVDEVQAFLDSLAR
jgi:trehalose 6-phosphate phosphatase